MQKFERWSHFIKKKHQCIFLNDQQLLSFPAAHLMANVQLCLPQLATKVGLELLFFLHSAHIWVCVEARMDSCFPFSLSFHCLYHRCTVTPQRGKMDSPCDASASLMLWFLQLLPLIQTTLPTPLWVIPIVFCVLCRKLWQQNTCRMQPAVYYKWIKIYILWRAHGRHEQFILVFLTAWL